MTCTEQALSTAYQNYISYGSTAYFPPETENACYQTIENLFTVSYQKESQYPSNLSISNYYNIPKLYGLMEQTNESKQSPQNSDVAAYLTTQQVFDPLALSLSGILAIQRAPLHLTGEGVLIAIIDTGVNFENPVFTQKNGENKILAYWDQTDHSGNPPSGYLFGTEYTREQLSGLSENNPPDTNSESEIRAQSPLPSRDTEFHGTIMASLAAGQNTVDYPISTAYPRGYTGAAPDANLIVVKLKQAKDTLKDYYLVPKEKIAYGEDDIMLAVSYCDRFATRNNLPLVICIGLGTNMGDHSGKTALTQYLEYIANKRKRAVVVGGGNEGNGAHHYSGTLDTKSQSVELRISEGVSGFLCEFWGALPDVFSLGIRTPGGEQIPPISGTLRQSISYDFIYEKAMITIQAGLVEASTGLQLITIRIQNPTAGIWSFTVDSVYPPALGKFFFYLPLSEHLEAPVYFLTPNPEETLTEPALGNTILSVANYNPANQSIAINSGRGYSTNGHICPDIAAPGFQIATISGARSGSSFATAIAAGAAAQFLQWAVVEGNVPNLRGRELQSYFIRGAVEQSGISYPNPSWGYGQLNMQSLFDRAR